MEDPAAAARARLPRLLDEEGDADLTRVDPEPLPVDVRTEWAVGYAAIASGVRATVAFVADPHEREAAARTLASRAPSTVAVGTNGGMLFYGRAPQGLPDDDPAIDRLDELAGRFGGRE